MYFIGLDLGKRRDFSALAIVERRELMASQLSAMHWRERAEKQEDKLVLRHLERMKLGTPYPEVVRRVVEVAQHRALAGPRRLIVDATGVGTPVVDMLKAARPGCAIVPVTITGGSAESSDGQVWHVPKLDLLAGLQALLEQGELRISKRMREAGTLVRELMDVRMRSTTSNRQRLGADGLGEHDDLVIAVALACWAARKGTVGERGQRLL